MEEKRKQKENLAQGEEEGVEVKHNKIVLN